MATNLELESSEEMATYGGFALSATAPNGNGALVTTRIAEDDVACLAMAMAAAHAHTTVTANGGAANGHVVNNGGLGFANGLSGEQADKALTPLIERALEEPISHKGES